MFKHKILVAVALYSTLLAAPAIAAEPLGSSWSDITKLPDFFTGEWESRQTFLNYPSNDPYTARAKAYISHYKPIQDIPFAGPNCKTPGMPTIERLGSPLKFFYQPGMIAIYIENSSMTRFIKLNGKHSARPNPSYLGESVGHFEGNTLVVDTTGFNNDILFQYGDLPGKGKGPFVQPSEAIFGPHGPNLRMVEKFRLIGPNTLEDKMTIYDSTVWKHPYVVKPVGIYKRLRGAAGWPHEWVCSTANIYPFEPGKDKTSFSEDPAKVLKRLMAASGERLVVPAGTHTHGATAKTTSTEAATPTYKPTIGDWIGVNAAVNSYTLGLEHHDAARFAKAFWPDATVTMEPVPGEKITVPYWKVEEGGPPKPVGGGPPVNAIGTNIAPWHLELAHDFKFLSPTRATDYGYFISVYPDLKTKITTVGLPGHYKDILEKRHGQWRILHRTTAIGVK
jgi:hypothetical protein